MSTFFQHSVGLGIVLLVTWVPYVTLGMLLKEKQEEIAKGGKTTILALMALFGVPTALVLTLLAVILEPTLRLTNALEALHRDHGCQGVVFGVGYPDSDPPNVFGPMQLMLCVDLSFVGMLAALPLHLLGTGLLAAIRGPAGGQSDSAESDRPPGCLSRWECPQRCVPLLRWLPSHGRTSLGHTHDRSGARRP